MIVTAGVVAARPMTRFSMYGVLKFGPLVFL